MASIRRIFSGRAIFLCVFCSLCGFDPKFALHAGETANDPPARRLNVLLIVSDDQRPDTIRALGNSIIETPHLDRLVREGTAFTRAVSPNPICVCSRAEIITGCTGFRNGVLDSGQLNLQLTRWPQAMRDAGYRTAHIGKWHVSGRPRDHGYGESLALFAGGAGQWAKADEKDWRGREITGYRGWVLQTEEGRKFPEKGVGLTANISATFADAAVEFIERKSSDPFFLQVNFTAPHDPLVMPPGYETKYVAARMPVPGNFRAEHPFDHGNFRGRDELLFPFPRTETGVREELAYYYAVISHMDEQIGRMLVALEKAGQSAHTLVIFTSDQGVAIGSHGLRGKQNMYEHTVGVPLLMRGPGVPRGKRLDAQVYLRDLYPTVCELAGVPIPKTVEATSFAPLLAGKPATIHPEIYGYFRDVQRMIRTDRWKLIRYPQIDRTQLFDLSRDPLELDDLSTDPQHAAVAGDLSRRLREWQRAAGDPLVK